MRILGCYRAFFGRRYNMKKFVLIILALAAMAFSCHQTKDQEKVASIDSLSNGGIETNWTQFDVGEFGDNNERPKDLGKFENTFEHEDKEQNLRQTLGVTWLSNDSIEFRLVTDDDLCGTDYWGKAENIHGALNPKSDKDEKGKLYLWTEFLNDQETYSMRIIVSRDKDNARIIYTDKSEEETDCIPTPNLVLVKKNAR